MKHLKEYEEFLNEDKDNFITDERIRNVWRSLYGDDFIDKHPSIFKILKQRPPITLKELERIWDETYDKNLKDELPEFWSKLK